MRRFGKSLFLFFLLSSWNSYALDFEGWPNFDPVPAPGKNPEPRQQPARDQKKQVTWLPWKDMRTYRYRTGRRYVGRGKWERYIAFEAHANVRISEVSYGPVKAPDLMLSPSNPVGQIVLQSPSVSIWKWNASLSSPPQEGSISVHYVSVFPLNGRLIYPHVTLSGTFPGSI
jgi:hypothetical protein